MTKGETHTDYFMDVGESYLLELTQRMAMGYRVKVQVGCNEDFQECFLVDLNDHTIVITRLDVDPDQATKHPLTTRADRWTLTRGACEHMHF